MIHYCTYFDRNYLTRGCALLASLRRYSDPFMLWVLCFDDETYEVLSSLKEPDVRPIRLEEFERGDDALNAQDRTHLQRAAIDAEALLDVELERHDLVFDQRHVLHIAFTNVPAHEAPGFFKRRCFQKRKVAPFPCHAVQDLAKPFDMAELAIVVAGLVGRT